MSVSLYRKDRSKSLDEIVGQKGVVKALKTAISKNSLSHAYLFTGPRGVGKTSVARILAFTINELPYNSDLPIDIIEIDAASNRGIEEIRDLREKVKVAPISAKYKIYIIDEVHMLTTPAFNALLKTLEEPPQHVIFILATTEGHKLPDTIISRTQHYNFSLATKSEVTNHLKNIAKLENISIDEEALSLIASHSGGSMRDALSTLDYVRHLSDNISAQDVRQNIGLPNQDIVDNLINQTSNNNAISILQELKTAENNNISASALANGIIATIKDQIQAGTFKLDTMKLAELIKVLSEVESNNKPYIALTVALLKNVDQKAQNNTITSPLATTIPSVKPSQDKPSKYPKLTTPAVVVKEEPVTSKTNPNIAKSNNTTNITSDFNHDIWQNILEDIRGSYNTLYSVLRVAELNLSELKDQKVHLKFQFPFHQKRISEQKNSLVLHNKFTEHGYGDLQIICGVVDQPNKNKQMQQNTEPSSEPNNVLNQIRGVFDGAEVIE